MAGSASPAGQSIHLKESFPCLPSQTSNFAWGPGCSWTESPSRWTRGTRSAWSGATVPARPP
ncbi:hypothetical protein ACFFX0_04120 [Citricoccus parietis]|uniref:Uncharacterized protein n=1 Tax=Citricoccus parietis TaxID=592307 RepID=A0ABV5FUQ6_9MICC